MNYLDLLFDYYIVALHVFVMKSKVCIALFKDFIKQAVNLVCITNFFKGEKNETT